jgi:hypothetical protein
VNFIKYLRNIFWDVREGVEIAGPAGTALTGWSLVFYTGRYVGIFSGILGESNKMYLETKLKGLIPNLQNGFGCLFFRIRGLKNGSSKHGDGKIS